MASPTPSPSQPAAGPRSGTQISAGQLLRYGLLLFVGAAFLDGLLRIIMGAAVISFLQQYAAWGARINLAGPALTIFSGIIVLGAAVVILPLAGIPISIIPGPSIDLSNPNLRSLATDKRVVLASMMIVFTLFIDSVSLLVLRATVAGVTELVAAILLGAAYFALMRSEVLRIPPLILSLIVLVGGIFLTIAGFTGAGTLMSVHLGVAGIGLIIAAIPMLLSSINPQTVSSVNKLFIVVALVLTIALIVGGAVNIWNSVGYFRYGGILAASGAIGVLTGLLGLIAGLLLMIVALIKVGKALQATPTQPQQPSTPAAPSEGAGGPPVPPPPPPE